MVRARNNNPLERPISFSKQGHLVVLLWSMELGVYIMPQFVPKIIFVDYYSLWTTTCTKNNVCTTSIVALIIKFWATRNVFKVV
jgi:hypothetical protein